MPKIVVRSLQALDSAESLFKCTDAVSFVMKKSTQGMNPFPLCGETMMLVVMPAR